ncbi:hypothetical protein Q7P37_007965 [Cladosporium fusiforme]
MASQDNTGAVAIVTLETVSPPSLSFEETAAARETSPAKGLREAGTPSRPPQKDLNHLYRVLRQELYGEPEGAENDALPQQASPSGGATSATQQIPDLPVSEDLTSAVDNGSADTTTGTEPTSAGMAAAWAEFSAELPPLPEGDAYIAPLTEERMLEMAAAQQAAFDKIQLAPSEEGAAGVGSTWGMPAQEHLLPQPAAEPAAFNGFQQPNVFGAADAGMGFAMPEQEIPLLQPAAQPAALEDMQQPLFEDAADMGFDWDTFADEQFPLQPAAQPAAFDGVQQPDFFGAVDIGMDYAMPQQEMILPKFAAEPAAFNGVQQPLFEGVADMGVNMHMPMPAQEILLPLQAGAIPAPLLANQQPPLEGVAGNIANPPRRAAAARGRNREGQTAGWVQALKHHKRCEDPEHCSKDCMLSERFPRTRLLWSTQRFSVQQQGERKIVSGLALQRLTGEPGLKVLGEVDNDGKVNHKVKTVKRIEDESARQA